MTIASLLNQEKSSWRNGVLHWLSEGSRSKQLQGTIQFLVHVSFASSYTASLDVLLAG